MPCAELLAARLGLAVGRELRELPLLGRVWGLLKMPVGRDIGIVLVGIVNVSLLRFCSVGFEVDAEIHRLLGRGAFADCAPLDVRRCSHSA